MLMLMNQLELRELLEHSADLSASMLSIIISRMLIVMVTYLEQY